MSTAADPASHPTTAPEPPPPSTSPLDEHPAPVADTRKRSGRAIASLILGIIAVLVSVFPIAGLALGIIGLVIGANAAADIRRTGQAGAGQARAGQILGTIAIVLSIGIWILAAVALS
jgi:hypothetical protein